MRQIDFDPPKWNPVRMWCGILLVLGSIVAYLAGKLSEGDTILIFWIGFGLALFAAEKRHETF